MQKVITVQLVSVLCFAFVCLGCESYEFSNLEVSHVGWDKVKIETAYIKKGIFQKKKVLASSEQIILETPTQADPIYRGDSHIIDIPDAKLPDGAEILVQVNTRFEDGKAITAQTTIKTSPKLYSVGHNIQYPYSATGDNAYCDISYVKSRPVFGGSTDTEELENGLSFPTTIRFFVDADTSINITSSVPEGKQIIDLSQSPQFGAFESNLKNHINQHQKTELSSRIEAVINGRTVSFLLKKKIVYEQKSREEQLAVCRSLGDYVAQQFQQKISPNSGKSSYGTIDESTCTYDPFHHKYEASVLISWESTSGFLSGYRTFQIKGTLTGYTIVSKVNFMIDETNDALRESEGENNTLYSSGYTYQFDFPNIVL